MAGQPPEPSWPPAGQDQTQARAAWPPPPPPQQQAQSQQPSFTPQGGAQQDGYGYPQQPAPGYPPPGYAAAAQEKQGYPGQEQTYAGQEQGYPGPDQAQWPAAPSPQAAHFGQPKLKGEKGFVGSLFDFSFTSMVTPKIIKVLYALVTASTLLWALVFLLIAIHNYHVPGAIFTILIGDPLFVLVTLALWRVVLEYFMVTFRLHEDVKVLRRKAEIEV
jgi:hypothetical protein